MSILGNKIKQERENLNLTREDLGKKIGVSYSAIAMYEQGNREPNNELILKMCELFNCSIDYLMGKSIYRNYEDYQEAEEFALKNISILNKEEVQQIALILNSINQNKIENADDFIHNEISNFNSNNKETLIKIITLLHHKYHDKNLPNMKNVFVLDKNSSINDWKEAENLISINKQEDDYKLFNIPVLGKITAGQPILAEEYLEGYLPVDPNIYGMTTADDYFYLKVSGESMNLKVHNGDYALIHKQDYAENGDIIVAIVNGDDEATLKRYKKLTDEMIMLEPMSTYPLEPIVINLKETNFKIIGKAIGQFGKF